MSAGDPIDNAVTQKNFTLIPLATAGDRMFLSHIWCGETGFRHKKMTPDYPASQRKENIGYGTHNKRGCQLSAHIKARQGPYTNGNATAPPRPCPEGASCSRLRVYKKLGGFDVRFRVYDAIC